MTVEYKIYADTAYLIGVREGERDTLTIKIEGYGDGYVRAGALCAPLVGGEAKFQKTTLPEGELRIEFIHGGALIPLSAITHIHGALSPVPISTTDLCEVNSRLLGLAMAVDELCGDVKGLRHAVFGTTIL